MEENTNNTELREKKRKKRWWLKTIYFLVAIFIIIDAFLFFLATPLLKTYLQNKIVERTEGLFSVNFERISIELSTRRLALEGFELTSDTIVYNKLLQENKVKAALYNISCNSIELWGTGIYSLVSRGRISASELKLVEPVVELKKLPNQDSTTQTSRDFVHEDLYPAVSKYFDEVKIKRIFLENGKFLLNLNKDSLTNTTHLGYVSVNLNEFLLNEDHFLKKDKLFYANDIQLKLNDYKVSLSDKVHFISVDSLNISTKTSRLVAKNVGMQPINQSKEFLSRIDQNYFKIFAPKIVLRGFNIHQLYFDLNIKIRKINITSPLVDLVNKHTKISQRKNSFNKSSEIDLSKLIEGKLSSIKVDTFKINNGKLNFYHHNWFRSPSYKAKHFLLSLHNFDLHENAGDNINKIFYSDSIQLKLDTFTAKLPDKVHALYAKSIDVLSANKKIEAKGLSLKPLWKKEKSNQLNISIPSLTIAGVDLFKLYHQRLLTIGGLHISPSNINLKLIKKEKSENDTIEKENPLAIITTNFVNQLYIRNFNLRKSNFNVELFEEDSTGYTYNGETAFELNKFLIDQSTFSNNKNSLFYAEQFRLIFKNYKQVLKDKTHILKVSSVEISTIDSIIELAGLKVFPKNEKEKLNLKTANRIYDINLIQAYLRGVDINKAYNDSSLIAQSISVLRPNITIFNNLNKSTKNKITAVEKTFEDDSANTGVFKRIIAAYFKHINVGTFNIDNANVKLANIDTIGKKDLLLSGKLSARLNKFIFNATNTTKEEQISYSDNISFRITNFFSRLFRNNYQLKFKLARFSSKDSLLSASVVRLFPTRIYEMSNQSNQLFSFYAPNVESKGVKISELIDNDVLNLGRLTIKNPSLAITQKKAVKISNPLLNKSDSVKKAMKIAKIKFDEINITDGVVGILEESFDIEKMTSNTKLNLSIRNLELDTSSFSNPFELFSNLDATLSLHETHFQLPNNKNFIDVGKIELNTLKKQITGKNIEFKTIANKALKENGTILEEFITPTISLSGFELGTLIAQKEFFSEQLIVETPSISLLNKKGEPKNPPIKIAQLNLYNKIKNSLRAARLNNIRVNNAKININSREGFNTSKSTYNQIFANINGLLIDSLHQNDNRILSADDIAINMKNYHFNFADSLYHLSIKNFGFSTGQKSAFASGINLNPNYGRQEYADLLEKEINLSYLKSDKIQAEHVNFQRLFDNKEFLAGRINLDKIKFHAYKYKQYPLDSVRKVALPLEHLWKAKNLIKIDTLKITNSYIGHDILGKNAKEDGFLDFTGVNIEMLNLTNDQEAIKNEEVTSITASAYLMDESLLTSSFRFPIASKYGEYVYGGHLDTFQMSSINPLLENLLFVTIQDGTINGLDFKVTTNEDYSTGKLTMLYDNLKLGLLSKKKSDSLVVERRGLFSMVANSIVRDKNPRRKAIGPKKGRIYFERNPYRSVFNYWTFSLLSGMQSTLGFRSKQLKERLKIEKDTSKFNKLYRKKNYKLTKKAQKVYDKQIEKEVKDEQKNRKKEERQKKKEKRKNKKSITETAFLKPENFEWNQS